jgi:hypothetical protein
MAAGLLSRWQATTLIPAFIAVIAFVAVALIFGKKGLLALTAIMFVGAMLTAGRKTRWRVLGEICRFVIILLSMLIWVITLSMAARSGFTAMVASTLLPGIAQAYWIGDLLAAGKPLTHPFILMCGAWLALFATMVVAYAKAGPPEPDQDTD